MKSPFVPDIRAYPNPGEGPGYGVTVFDADMKPVAIGFGATQHEAFQNAKTIGLAMNGTPFLLGAIDEAEEIIVSRQLDDPHALSVLRRLRVARERATHFLISEDEKNMYEAEAADAERRAEAESEEEHQAEAEQKARHADERFESDFP